ncbi:MAG: hypothetical protein JEZ14_11965 [Marinilabiliaceae bacterium]|nr:hypothetical protein [Marinilabiliaceae bacterium]
MAKTNKISIDENNFEFWLAVSGYMPARTEKELEYSEIIIEHMYKDVDVPAIDIDKIVNGRIKCGVRTKIVDISNRADISSLKMVARKGTSTIPDEILKRMKDKHNKKDED